jgi:hypothetical protein
MPGQFGGNLLEDHGDLRAAPLRVVVRGGSRGRRTGAVTAGELIKRLPSGAVPIAQAHVILVSGTMPY